MSLYLLVTSLNCEAIYQSHCYTIIEEGKTFTDGRQACVDGGADLAVITSADEHTFVKGLVR